MCVYPHVCVTSTDHASAAKPGGALTVHDGTRTSAKEERQI